VRFGAIGPVRCLFSSLLSTRALCLSRCGGKPRFLFSILFLFSHFLFRLLFSAGSCVSGSNQRLRSHLSSSSPSFRALISLDFPSRVIANLNVPCACFVYLCCLISFTRVGLCLAPTFLTRFREDETPWFSRPDTFPFLENMRFRGSFLCVLLVCWEKQWRIARVPYRWIRVCKGEVRKEQGLAPAGAIRTIPLLFQLLPFSSAQHSVALGHSSKNLQRARRIYLIEEMISTQLRALVS
jgi:hypothetical protein